MELWATLGRFPLIFLAAETQSCINLNNKVHSVWFIIVMQ